MDGGANIPAEMDAAIYRSPGCVSVERVPVPSIGSRELLVRIDSCGVCGTDLKKIEYGLQPGPRIFGHEMAGIVVSAGTQVTDWAPRDRVAVLHHVSCGHCFFCDHGLDAQCATYQRTATTAGFEPAGGGFAQYIRVCEWALSRGVVRVPDHVSLETAAFLEPVNTCLKGIRRTGLAANDTLMVFGLGSIGLILARLGALADLCVLGVDPSADRRAAASRLLGQTAYAPASDDLMERVSSLTDNRGVDAAIVATPEAAAIADAVAAVRPGGRVVLFASTRKTETAELAVGSICTGDREIVGSYSGSLDLVWEASQLVFGGRLALADLVTHRFALDDIQEAIQTASHPGAGVLKVMVQPNLEEEPSRIAPVDLPDPLPPPFCP